MSRSRKWWHKVNHDRLLRDQFVWNLPDEVLGLLTRIQCMAGSTEKGHASGVLYAESGEKISVDDFCFLMSRGNKEQAAVVRERLDVLCQAKQLIVKNGSIKLASWEGDQELPANLDCDRKRSSADEALASAARGFVDELERFSTRLCRREFSEPELLSFIKARRGGYLKTQKRFLEVLIETGVCRYDADGLVALASLAPAAPAGVGFSGAGGDGAESAGGLGENFPNGKFPIEPDPEEESRKGSYLTSQLDSAGGGGRRERSEEEFPAVVLDVPGDAYRVEDVLAASMSFLCRSPGWQGRRCGDKPPSAQVLRSLWRKLRDDVGPPAAERIWREVLSAAIEDRLDKSSWRNWVGLFVSRVNRQLEFAE